jgi:ABC-type cobalt transport system, permease component CbiQ and related transporters
MYKQFLTYVDGNSFLHKLDPRTKIITLIILGITIFYTFHLISLFSLFALFFAAAAIAQIPLKKLFLSVRPMLFFIGIVFLLHFLFTSDPIFEDVYITAEIIDSIYLYGDDSEYILIQPHIIRAFPGAYFSIMPGFYSFITGIGVALKFILLILFASLMSATTKQSAIIQGIEKLIRPIPLKFL